jgi:GT2 family glycosyltransferase/glycosyltransferase involved in cell wall biosynthesis
MQQVNMRVDYVVIAYRSAADLPDCLDTIAVDAPPDAKVILVDNASPDESAAVAKAHPIGALVLSSATNLGFGGGCNLAAAESNADCLFLVNPDARLRPGTTATLLRALTDDPTLGVAGPRVLDPSGESRASSGGAEPSFGSVVGHFLLLGRVPGLRRPFRPLQLADPSLPARPDWLSGAALLVRRTAFDQAGGFDERMFLYMEDVDLCRRIRADGWGVAYRPDAIVEHRIGGSQAADQPVRWFRAFHAYLAARRGGLVARASSGVVALGLGLRWLAYLRTRPANAARVGQGARAAAALAIGITVGPELDRASAPHIRSADARPEGGRVTRRRVLIVTREGPPSLGPHAIRIAKLAKYLPDFGWEPTILTVPEDYAWYIDHQLTSDLGGTPIERVPRLLGAVAHPTASVTRSSATAATPVERRWQGRLRRLRAAAARTFLIPDSAVLWAIPAARRAAHLSHDFEAVLTTGPPFSTHLVGDRLRRRQKMPWVAEYRDNWTVNPLYRRSRILQRINVRLDRRFLATADAIVVVSDAAAGELATRWPGIADRIVVAMNGFDPDDLPETTARSAKFEIAHAGTLDERRDPRPFFEALRLLANENPAFARAMNVRLMGTIPPWAVESAEAAIGADRVAYDGLVSHREALDRAGRAAVLLGITTKSEAGGAGLTSKLFEYLALRKPILMLAHSGPARDIVFSTGAGLVVEPDDVPAIKDALFRLFEEWETGNERKADDETLTLLTRRATAQCVAHALDAARLRAGDS